MKYKIKEGLVWEEISGEVVVLDSNKGEYFNLNKTAGEIWKSLKRPLNEEQIINIFYLKYGKVNETKIVRDVKEFISTLMINELVETI